MSGEQMIIASEMIDNVLGIASEEFVASLS
jgi:hypothetical protein